MSPLPDIDIRPEQWAIVESILKHHVPAHEVWAFGSRAKKSAKPYSDLDLCVLSVHPLGLSLRAELTEAFAESDLPWKVDVVDWATTSESFRQIIQANKVVLQKASGAASSPGDSDVGECE
ncbi:MAG: DNA polymerase subunit beta [Comamonadaceae bacterium]|nr:MAG: DNA polymerase subunit beta [Comamonadaceae bacterium]